MIAAWLRDLLNKAGKKEAVPEPEQRDLLLTDVWINEMLQSESDCIYEVSRLEPFRLRHVRASKRRRSRPRSSIEPWRPLSGSWSLVSLVLGVSSVKPCELPGRTRRRS